MTHKKKRARRKGNNPLLFMLYPSYHTIMNLAITAFIILIITLIIYSIISFKNKQLDHKLKERTNGDQHNPNQTTAK